MQTDPATYLRSLGYERVALGNETYCPECNGHGTFYSDRLARDIACYDCSGEGVIVDELAVAS